MTWNEKIIRLQDKSTQELMHAQNLRPVEEDDDHIWKIKFTPIKKEAQVLKKDGSVDINARPLTLEEAKNHNSFRRERGAIIQALRADSTPSTLTEEKKERAQDAFMRTFSLASLKEKFKTMLAHLHKPTPEEIMAEALRKSKQ